MAMEVGQQPQRKALSHHTENHKSKAIQSEFSERGGYIKTKTRSHHAELLTHPQDKKWLVYCK